MLSGYPNNLNVQLLVSLLKAHGIKKVIASPGTTNFEFVAALQYDGGFEIYSSIDERGAAYIACGMAAESNEPVVITCTEATASRNYFSGLSEAYYRQLPVLAVTAVHGYERIGHLNPQVIDRSAAPYDTFKLKVHLNPVSNEGEIWESNLKINNAILELKRHGGGPVHIDLPAGNSNNLKFTAKELIKGRTIHRYTLSDELPGLPIGKTVVFVGSHMTFSDEETNLLDDFCLAFDAVVFCDHTSGYYGKYRIQSNLLARQNITYDIFNNIETLIHFGGPTTDDRTFKKLSGVKRVWRVNPDGELRDPFKKLEAVFEMTEKSFLNYYLMASTSTRKSKESFNSQIIAAKECVNKLHYSVDEIPFSNTYAAAVLSSKLPPYSTIHFGLSNTIRAWSMFELPATVKASCNAGCRGIDGILSAAVGASFARKDKLFFCVLGDLSFFYDINSLGNRFINGNFRILLVNDNGGSIFKSGWNPIYRHLEYEEIDKYIAAADHFGGRNSEVAKSYAESLGFKYMSASNKEEFELNYPRFISPEIQERPMLFELKTKDLDEREAFDMMSNLDVSAAAQLTNYSKQILGEKGVKIVKKLIGKK